MAIDTNSLVYLIDPFWQGEGINGKPLVGGYMTVFYAGTDLKYITYQNFDGTENPFKIPLGADGRATILVEAQYTYDCYLYDSFGNLAASRLNVKPNIGGGNISIKGRTYHGIEPVVVNNQYNLISARNIPLGVQEPLHFVEDSESACIIGMSGDFVTHPELSSYATKDWVNDQSYMHEYMASAFYPMESNPSGYLTEHQSLDGYMETDKLETADGKITGYDGTAFAGGGSVDPNEFIPWSASSTFQSAGNYATTDDLTAYYPNSNPDGFINSDAISAMATTGFVADVSADITAMIPTALTGDYLTKDSADTLYQPLGDYATTADLTGKQDILTFNYTDTDEISGINGSAIHSEGGSVTGEYELSAGNGISINNDPIEQKTVISVSGDYLTKDSADTLYQPTGNYLSSNALEGYATENWVTSQGYITTETDWTNTITAASANAYNEATAAIPTGLATTGDLASVSADITAQIPTDLFTKASADTLYQPIGDYLTTGDSANFATTGDVEDLITSISETYQTTAGMTAYLTTADSAEFMTTAERSDYIPTGVSSEFYTTANTANYISEVPNTYLQNSDLSTADGKVTAISGIPLSAGGDVPEGVMVESAVEYNAVNEISAYNGSAIAQYGAEKQWLQHDDTLVHAANSAQYALGVNVSAVGELLGVSGPVLNQETFAGYWNGQEVYQKLVTATMQVNSTYTTAVLMSGVLGATTYKSAWLDLSNSFIDFNNSLNFPGNGWTVGNNNRHGEVYYEYTQDRLVCRAIDTAGTFTAKFYETIKYIKQ